MITLSYDEAVSLLHEAVEERGDDYVYQNDTGDPMSRQCYYVHEDAKPGCIIGFIFMRAGLPASAFSECNSAPVHTLFSRGLVSADARTRYLLIEVQSSQDHRQTWGNAVRESLRATESNTQVLVYS